MSLPEGRSWKTGKSGVANLCVTNGVKGARDDKLEGIKSILPWELDEVSTDLIP